jgi:hypothetical protein
MVFIYELKTILADFKYLSIPLPSFVLPSKNYGVCVNIDSNVE